MFKKVIAIAMAATMAFSVAPVATVASTAKAETITTPTDLSRISKKPVLSYTFDGNDKDLKLNGTAKVENGVLTITEMPEADKNNKKNQNSFSDGRPFNSQLEIRLTIQNIHHPQFCKF